MEPSGRKNGKAVSCTAVRDALQRRVPFLVWIRNYKSGMAVSDLVAGITLGLTMLPQSIAYAQLAGISPQYGLYSAFLGGFVYMFLGNIKQVVIGPASITAILTIQFTRDLSIGFVQLLTFCTGVVQLGMAVLRLGFLVDFISKPVVSAFTSATAIIILVAQLPPLLGLSFKVHGCIDTIIKVAGHVREVRPADACLGVTCIAFLWSVKALNLIPTDPKRPLGRSLWFFSISKNALCITVATVVASQMNRSLEGGVPFAVVGNMPPGLPSLHLPPFAGISTAEGNYTLVEMMGKLGAGVVVMPVVGVLINVAIGKAYGDGSMTGDTLDASQELLALCTCNLLGSLVQAIPVAGALTRSAVAEASGVRTPIAGLYCSMLIVAALAYLTPYFYFIPRSTLAAVLIVAVTSLVDANIVPRLWRTSKRDFVVLVATFVTCLWLGVEVGLVLGMAMDATRLLQPWARPSITDEVQRCGAAMYLMVRPNVGVLYPGVDVLRTHTLNVAAALGQGELPVVVDCTSVVDVDYTAAMTLVSLSNALNERGQRLLLLGAIPKVRTLLQAAGLDSHVLCDEEDLEASVQGESRSCEPATSCPLLPINDKEES